MELTDDYTLYDLITKHNKLIKKIYISKYIFIVINVWC